MSARIRIDTIRRLVAICTLVTIACIGLSAATAWLDGDELRNRVLTAFDSGALVIPPYLGDEKRRGRYSVNDCLILQIILFGQEDWKNVAVRSRTILGQPDVTACEALLDYARDPSSEPITYDFSRYFFAAKALIAPALLTLSVDNIRTLLRLIVYGLLLFVAAGSLFRLFHPSPTGRLLPVTLLVISFWWLIAYDLRYYAPLFAHGFSEIVLAGYMAYALICTPPKNHGSLPSRIIMLGALTACFELLSGPSLLAASLATLIDFSQRPNRPQPLIRAFKIYFGVALSIILTLLILQLFVLFISGPEAVKQFFWHLLLRMDLHLVLNVPMEEAWKVPSNLKNYTLYEALSALVTSLPMLTHSHKIAAYLLFSSSVLALGISLLAGLLRAKSRPVLIYVAIAASIALWAVVFSNHTVIHAWAMVRMAVLLPICATLSMIYLFESIEQPHDVIHMAHK